MTSLKKAAKRTVIVIRNLAQIQIQAGLASIMNNNSIDKQHAIF
jgi:hypothetical protein